ncbi:Uu.00g068320.m01.CDS01 [Anthostomella pinea]|uniref:Uu.00g068320.m01.CDS01 n=1 Tax=Anthostomella pinea TaxID=933095 RepID=A0AAI8YL21_9PEZI|nr:Uu.00g068320.m01.CDS01 [Anthostomella pinea]
MERDWVECLAELRQFASSLTPAEARYLKMILRTSGKPDIIYELPVEIVAHITTYLKAKDLAFCLAVSTGWRDKLLSDVIIDRFTRRWPCLRQSHATKADFLAMLSSILWGSHGHKTAHRRAGATRLFPWDNDTFYEPATEVRHIGQSKSDGMCNTPEGRSPSTFYHEGKLAWLASDDTLVVLDDFKLRTRRLFTVPTGLLSGPRVWPMGLGSELLVGSVGNLLVAWDHVTNQYQEKKLPAQAKRCAIQGRNVAIVLFGGGVMLWTFGGKLLELTTSPVLSHLALIFDEEATKAWKTNLHVFIHPRDDSTLFLASGYPITGDQHPHPAVRRTLHEFKNADYIQTTSFEGRRWPHVAEAPLDIRLVTNETHMIDFGLLEDDEGHGRLRGVIFDLYRRRFSTISDGTSENEEDWRHITWNCSFKEGEELRSDLDYRVTLHDHGYQVISLQPGVTL